MSASHFWNYFFILSGIFLLSSSCGSQVSSSSNPDAVSWDPVVVGPKNRFHPGNTHDTTLVSQYIRCIFQDSKGSYWFGPAGRSVARYDGDTLRYFSVQEFFYGNKNLERDYGNSVHAIAEDQNGNIWFGTDLGVIRYDGQHFRSYTEDHGLQNTRIGRQSILSAKSGELWVGTQDGIFRYNSLADTTGGKCFEKFTLIPAIQVRHLMEDDRGQIWFASESRGVFRYDGNTVENLSAIEGFGNNYAGGMAQDNEGNYWFTMNDGICKYDGESFTTYTTKDGFGGSEVWGILIEESGIIWITSRGSTTRFDPSLASASAFTVFTEKDGMNCCVQCMYQDRSGNVWWGSGEGLLRFDGEGFYKVRQRGPW